MNDSQMPASGPAQGPSEVPVHERLFGRKTGRHTHPATHPRWLEFSDSNCPVCAAARPRRPDRKYVTTTQLGSNAFHWTMVLCTGGLWLIVWPLFRRKWVTRVRYR